MNAVEPIRAIYDGKTFVPTTPVKLKKNQQAIVMIVENDLPKEDAPWRAFFGIMPPDACVEIEEALKETERVDVDGW